MTMPSAVRILVVDDSMSARREVVSILGDRYEVTEAQHGAEALGLAKSQAFDLVLTDLNMPVMGGIEMTRILRAMPAYARVPVFAITTESSDEMLRSGKSAGITAWIVKPVNPRLLSMAVGKALAV